MYEAMDIKPSEIDIYLMKYQEDINKYGIIHRYSSFDYCYNYFQKFHKENRVHEIANDENIEMSTLQLGFYLASWGMYRGSTSLLRHSAPILKPVINYISSKEALLYWKTDANSCEENISNLANLYGDIYNVLYFPIPILHGKGGEKPTPILITKIMLGIFGNTPALDKFFMTGIGQPQFIENKEKNYLKNLNKVVAVWDNIYEFYEKNKAIINLYQVKSLDFKNGTNVYNYPQSKLIDMIFFKKGEEKILQLKRTEIEKKQKIS